MFNKFLKNSSLLGHQKKFLLSREVKCNINHYIIRNIFIIFLLKITETRTFITQNPVSIFQIYPKTKNLKLFVIPPLVITFIISINNFYN